MTAGFSTTWCRPGLLLACAALLLLLSISPARGRVMLTGAERFQVGFRDLRPNVDEGYGHRYYYQVPKNARGTVVFIHACVHSGYNYWPYSADCEECRGLPEELSHTLQALRLGYAVFTVSSSDRETGCWSWNNDGDQVGALLNKWLDDWGMRDLPVYGAGISSGASFLLKLPRHVKFSGIVSEALGVDPNAWGYDQAVDGEFPPTVYVSMEQDTSTAERIRENVQVLRDIGTPVQMIKVYPRKVYPTYFSDRDPWYINDTFSNAIAQGLYSISMIDKQGNVIEDPRYTTRPWLAELQKEVPALRGSGSAGLAPAFPDQQANDVTINGVYSLMNLAFAWHEIISDYTTASILWFESKAKANFQDLVDQYTYGLPPDINFTYTRNGPEIVLPGPAAITNATITNSTLPGCSQQYIVRPGDFCFFIASSMGMELDAFMAMNPTTNCTGLQPGDAVCVEAAPKPPPPPPRPSPSPPPSPRPPAPVSAPVPVPVPGDDASLDGAATPPGPPSPGTPHADTGGLSAGTQAGIAVGATAGAVLLAALLYGCCRRKRGAARAGGAGAPDLGEMHEPYGASAKLSIIPGVKERFDLTEVVEASGSPYSARRRIKTAFSESPHKSPHKRSGSGF
ncbi:hypothetical protein ABPG77_010146 [Micractinium sp. CCAP 211/92]